MYINLTEEEVHELLKLNKELTFQNRVLKSKQKRDKNIIKNLEEEVEKLENKNDFFHLWN